MILFQRAKAAPDLNQAVESYKAKAEGYLAKLEEAEIARAKFTRQENLSEYTDKDVLTRDSTVFSPSCSY